MNETVEEAYNWEVKIMELIQRAADGHISDEDVEFVMGLLTGSSEDPKKWLQELVDKIGPDNLKKLLGLWFIFG